MTATAMATATGAAPAVERWLPFEAQEGTVRLYCLPHAGGSASAYRAWSGRLGRVVVRPVQPPGRETRLRDVPHTRMHELVGELADVLLADEQGAYAVYGHSLGALVGFEVLREIRRRGGPDPVHFVVSGCAAPQEGPDQVEGVATMTQAQLVALLRRLGGTPDWMLRDATVLRMILPPFQADFAVKESYRYLPQPPLDVPITAIAGSTDPRADPGSMTGWREQTTGRFRAHTLSGGHFAVLEQAELTLSYLRGALRDWC